MKEIWKPFRSGVYEVSDLGRVRRAKQGKRGIKTTGRTHVGLLLALWMDEDGYIRCTLDSEGGRPWGVHQLVAEAFHGPCPAGHQIDHKDAHKWHNTPENLEYVTPQENRRRQTVLGLHPRGERHVHAKLTTEAIQHIRAVAAKHPRRQSALARTYGVSQALIWAVINRRVWQHV